MLRWVLTIMITSLLFFPEKGHYERPDTYGLAFEDVTLKTPDGVRLHAWYLKSEAEKGVLLHVHGNAGNISGRIYKVKGWLERGFSVLLLDYRGYGQSQGDIKHEDDLVTDTETGLMWLREVKNWPLKKVVLYGESLGSYPVLRLGVKHAPAAVVLEAPYTSFTDLAPIHYSLIPKFMVEALLRDFSLSNRDHIGDLKVPLFILHGTNDQTCPYFMGEKLFEMASEPKGFFSIQGGEHNNLLETAGNDFWEKPYQFVQGHLG